MPPATSGPSRAGPCSHLAMSSAARHDAAGGIGVVARRRARRGARCRRPLRAASRRCPPRWPPECTTSLLVMPTFARIRVRTKSSQVCPLNRLDHLAGDEIEDVVVGIGAPEADVAGLMNRSRRAISSRL